MNVVKHGQAHSVSVNMARIGQTLQIEDEDDGIGFDPASLQAASLTAAGDSVSSASAERMADLGGSLEIVAAPGKGCKATLVVPFEPAEEGDSQ